MCSHRLRINLNYCQCQWHEDSFWFFLILICIIAYLLLTIMRFFFFFSVSFVFISIKALKTLYGGQFTSLPQWIKANDLGILLHRLNTTFSLKLTPFIWCSLFLTWMLMFMLLQMSVKLTGWNTKTDKHSIFHRILLFTTIWAVRYVHVIEEPRIVTVEPAVIFSFPARSLFQLLRENVVLHAVSLSWESRFYMNVIWRVKTYQIIGIAY